MGMGEELKDLGIERLHNLTSFSEQGEILKSFSPQEQKEIRYKQRILSSLASFIGKDFRIPVELNRPGGGWHWDFKENKIMVDPQDLLEKPMDYLRFVTSHEGGHRRISRVDFIPEKTWNQPGFSFMMNAIEDPRINNFVAEAYPRFRGQMNVAYEADLDFEAKAKEKAKETVGYQPRFLRAGFEYIKQWHKEEKGEEPTLSEDLPEDVKKVVEDTLSSARDSWLRYPSKAEADRSENLVKDYAEVSYKINKDEVWPEFQKLVEEDLKDQKMQELLQEMMQGKGELEGAESDSTNNLPDNLTDKEQKELEKAIEESLKNSPDYVGEGQASPVDLESLSEGLKKKIKEFMEGLPEDKMKELEEKAKETIKGLEDQINQELEGKLAETKPGSDKDEDGKDKRVGSAVADRPGRSWSPETDKEVEKFRDFIKEKLEHNENIYEEIRREVLPLIDQLEADLREIFVARLASKWETGFKSGKKIDMKKRMQEKALGISAVESKAWQKREAPQEKDYAISLLVDLSGSMQGEKIYETFKATIVLAEVLNRLSINTEILGFNNRLYEYQTYGQDMSKEIRSNMGRILKEVEGQGARWNDDGWALEQASQRLAKQKATEKFLIVLSDGQPNPSPSHNADKYELPSVIEEVVTQTDQKLVGLGVGQGTGHVTSYYPNSIANVSVDEMSESLAELIREIVANYYTF